MTLRRILALNPATVAVNDPEDLQESRNTPGIPAERGVRIHSLLRTEQSAGVGPPGHASRGTTAKILIFADGADTNGAGATAADKDWRPVDLQIKLANISNLRRSLPARQTEMRRFVLFNRGRPSGQPQVLL